VTAIDSSGPLLMRAGKWLLDAPSAAWLLPLLRRRRGAIGALLALGMVAAAAALLPPWLTKLVIDEGLVAGAPDALIFWSVALFAAGLASLGLGALSSVLHMRASVGMLAELRAQLTRAVLERSPRWRAERQTGELMARLDGDAGEVQQFAFNALLTGTGSVLRLAGGMAMLFVLNWQLALVALALAPVELAFFAWARPRTELLARESRAERGLFAGRLAEMLAGLFPIQAALGEPAVAAGLAQAQGRLNRALIRAQLWGEATRAAPAILSAIMRSTVFVLGGLMVIRGDWPLGSLIAFIAYLGFLVGPMQSLIGLWHAQARVRAALDRIGGVMQPEPGPAWPARPARLPPGRGALSLESVSLEAGGRCLVEDLTAEVPPGAKVRISGPSGVGKSTLLALLQRHADPASGRILLDGIDICRLACDELRRAVALVPQRPFLLHGTVVENLRLTNPYATQSEMAAVLHLVGLAGRCPPDALLGEDGLTLSGGERQRLCLARALLAPARVLLLDEPLSEVDPRTIRRIMAGIDAARPCTRIIVTHGAEEAYGPFDLVIDIAERRASWAH
jgi:ATP-binding cassette, subfamily B, bacterial